MIGSRDFLFNCNVLGFHGQVPFDKVVAIIDRFDVLDLCEFGVNIRLNVGTHKLEDFVEKQATVHHDSISSERGSIHWYAFSRILTDA